MEVRQLHRWDLSPSEAIKVQNDLSRVVSTVNDVGIVERVAGVDTSVRGDQMRAAVVILSFPDFDLFEVSVAEQKPPFPYVPGLLSFREAPAILDAFERIQVEPDLIMVDGQGIAHPRRFGIAAHLGVILNKPTIGVAKSRLVGRHDEVGAEPGSTAYLYDDGEVIGIALRTRARSKPVYVSVGHKLDLETSLHYVLSSLRGHKLPEPIRQAHLTAGSAAGPRHDVMR